MTFAVGSLVKARGREWVVLPESDEQMLVLRPLGGTDEEIAGIYLPLETVEQASFDLPDPILTGDYLSARLLRDAVRLGFRSSAGPFRSFARLAFEPRPYQLVPLLVALKLDPVRLLIADDVGIGKTIEAGLIARELLDRGEVNRLAVLCPPQLAEQWQSELRDKFHIEAELVMSGTAARLERNIALGQSLFDLYPFVIVSMDFIKTGGRRDEFLRTCPELVIVDEAHTCASSEGRGRHQRHQLVSGLAKDPDRHIILVTATPHSGKEDAFRSLLTLLDEDFANLPHDLTGAENESSRRALAAHFIQRRRADIRHYMEADTPFPDREETEATYKLSPDYKKLFDRVLEYARELVRDAKDTSKNQFHQRVKWWSALALLRSMASSPAAAAATLRNRAATAEAETVEEADEIGRRTILDLMEDEAAEGTDVAPGSDLGAEEEESVGSHRRLLEMARAADALGGEKDNKLNKAIALVSDLIKDGYRPIVFCRFIPTAEYVAEELRKKLPKSVEIVSVTGILPPTEREARVLQLAESEKRVLVCTDCLSEGINLQEHFDAVLHYDLSWNPTRHEQREGRVDRFGQPTKIVRVLTYYGLDNQIDGVVLDVLLRKHRTIRSSLGISVPVPVDTEQVVEAIFEGLLLRSKASALDAYLPGFEEYMKPTREDLYGKWDAVTEREKRSRTLFAQESIKVEEVSRELQAAQAAVGSGVDVQSFTRSALQMTGASLQGKTPLSIDLSETPQGLRDLLSQSVGAGFKPKFLARFDLPLTEGQYYLTRTHPLIEGLASFVLESALDPLAAQGMKNPARRCGVIRTGAVEKRTTLLLVRFRYHIIKEKKGGESTQERVLRRPLLAEECGVLAFTGAPQNAEWLSSEDAEKILQASPDANVNPDQAHDFVQKVIDGFDGLRPHLDEAAKQLGAQLLEAHQRVRLASRQKGIQTNVEPNLPPDLLGIYVHLPVAR
jgi:superfamily II DNA or RNA helicase